MVGTLYTSYYANLSRGKGYRLSISRFNPKWLQSADIVGSLKGLAPSQELLIKYKQGLEWTLFIKEYMVGIDWQDIARLEYLLKCGYDVTVYCYEKPTEHCHRHILADIFREKGYKVAEIE